jgi:hypothetical protein
LLVAPGFKGVGAQQTMLAQEPQITRYRYGPGVLIDLRHLVGRIISFFRFHGFDEEFYREDLVVPPGEFREPVVGDDVGALLDIAQMIEPDCRLSGTSS